MITEYIPDECFNNSDKSAVRYIEICKELDNLLKDDKIDRELAERIASDIVELGEYFKYGLLFD